MRKIVEDIIARLKAKVPELRYIAQDWGQLTYYDKTSTPVKYPCALVNISSATFEDIGMDTQQGLLQIQVDIADLFTQVSSHAPADLRDRELRLYDTARHVYQALEGWTGGKDYTSLNRSSYARAIRKDGISLQTLVFTLNWQDDSAMPQPLTATDPNLQIITAKLKCNGKK